MLQRPNIASWATFISRAHLAQPSSPSLPFFISCQLHCDREPVWVQTTLLPSPWVAGGSRYLDLWITGSYLKFLLGSISVNCTSCDNLSPLAFFPLGKSFWFQGCLSPSWSHQVDGPLLVSLESLWLFLTFHSREMSDFTGRDGLPQKCPWPRATESKGTSRSCERGLKLQTGCLHSRVSASGLLLGE